jgi:hypothetical protein
MATKSDTDDPKSDGNTADPAATVPDSPTHTIGPSIAAASPALMRVLESAARLQELVPDAVLVGGSVAALYAGHRDSYDHDHFVVNLSDRFDAVLDAVESEDGWVTNRLVPGKLILGQIGDIETGVRQLIRTTPLETTEIVLPSGLTLTVPTDAETLRIKAFLIVRRNQTRDYLDVAALADQVGPPSAARTVRQIDDYYADQRGEGDGVASQVYRQLSDPRPADAATTQQLPTYKNLAPRWHEWKAVADMCRSVADAMLDGVN